MPSILLWRSTTRSQFAGDICQRCLVLPQSRWSRRCISSTLVHHDAAATATPEPAIEVERLPALQLLEQRGLINQIAGDRDVLDKALRSRQMHIYCGIDPTAQSMHLGHLLPFMVLFWLYRYGHSVVNLVGGGTVRVGDPTGRLQSRGKLANTERQLNYNSIVDQVKSIWDHAHHLCEKYDGTSKPISTRGQRQVLNNAQWLDTLNLMDFLRDLGTGVRLGAMLGRDTVKNKMEKGDGMSFAELTYPLLQAWDWWHMYKEQSVQIQVGGSDQYGNIIAGIDAIKYITQNSEHDLKGREQGTTAKFREDEAPFGLTTPLLTTSSGEKFGKSAGNAVWLDAKLTSPFDLYGFLLRTSDADVERYLKLFTIVSLEEITTLIASHAENPGKRVAQHRLAVEVLDLVHGAEVATRTQAAHRESRAPTLATFGITRDPASTSNFPKTSTSGGSEGEGLDSAETQRILLPTSLFDGQALDTILLNAKLVDNKASARRLVHAGGLYVASIVEQANTSHESSSTHPADDHASDVLTFHKVKNSRPSDIKEMMEHGNLLILRMGKWKVRIIEIIDDATYEEKWRSGAVDAPEAWLQRINERDR